jgi:hypothetical protein
MLARKLARRGVTLSAASLATLLPAMTASAMQPTLVAATVKAAVLTAARESAAGLVSAQTLALSEGVLKTMFLSKLKVVSLIVLGVALGAFGAGIFGVPGAANQPAAQAAQTNPPDQPKQTAADPEPLDGVLLLDEQIQQDLRLSKNQIQRITTVSSDVDNKNKDTREEIVRLQKQIDELNKQIERMRTGIDTQRSRALAKAAPDILSSHALQRVRQIQRQKVGLPGLLKDPKIQRMLKLNDEQWRKIEKILKEQETTSAAYGTRPWLVNNLYSYQDIGTSSSTARVFMWDARTGKRVRNDLLNVWTEYFAIAGTVHDYGPLMDVLTESQRRMVLQWVGEPYHSHAWQEVWEKYKKRD